MVKVESNRGKDGMLVLAGIEFIFFPVDAMFWI